MIQLQPDAQAKTISYHPEIILAVAWQQFNAMGAAVIHAPGKAGRVLCDLKSLLPAEVPDLRMEVAV